MFQLQKQMHFFFIKAIQGFINVTYGILML